MDNGAGVVEYADRIRPESAGSSRTSAGWGCAAIAPALRRRSGKRHGGCAAGRNEEAHGDLLPEEKVAYMQRLMKEGERVLMVGDGTNDAPALSTATVGIALASGGGGISAEAADAVILADDPSRWPRRSKSAAVRFGWRGRASGRGWG